MKCVNSFTIVNNRLGSTQFSSVFSQESLVFVDFDRPELKGLFLNSILANSRKMKWLDDLRRMLLQGLAMDDCNIASILQSSGQSQQIMHISIRSSSHSNFPGLAKIEFRNSISLNQKISKIASFKKIFYISSGKAE